MTIEPDIRVYKNKDEKRPQFINTSNYDEGNHYESKVKMDLHTGTHMDAPLHMIKDGDTIDQTELSKCMGQSIVIDLTHLDDHISAKDLEKADIKEGDIVLLKTKNSLRKDFHFQFIYLHREGAQYLVDKGVKAIGIDALGIERGDPEHRTHKIILGQGIPIIEGLALKDIKEGRYEFVGLPLKFKGLEGSPMRAILIEEEK